MTELFDPPPPPAPPLPELPVTIVCPECKREFSREDWDALHHVCPCILPELAPAALAALAESSQTLLDKARAACDVFFRSETECGAEMLDAMTSLRAAVQEHD